MQTVYASIAFMLSRKYLATFAPGFEVAVGDLLGRTLPDCGNPVLSSGMALFSHSADIEAVSSLAFFNNVFLILREWNTAASPFHDLVKSSAGKSDLGSYKEPLVALADNAGPGVNSGIGSFRVRFSKENQFTSVDKNLMDFSEQFISRVTGLRADRMEPGIEFWYIIRREGRSFFAARLTKKASIEKYLAKGELRPEIAQLLAGMARIGDGDRVLCDPFAGYGAIPEQLSILRTDAIIHASDIDPNLTAELSRRFALKKNVSVHTGDALRLEWLEDASVDLVVTDPPWGFWDDDAYKGERSIERLYEGMLKGFDRVLSSHGRAFVLTGAKREFAEAVENSAAFAQSAGKEHFRTDILVNGKKSAVFSLARD